MEPAPLLFSESDDFQTLTIFSNVLIQFSFGLVILYSPSLWGVLYLLKYGMHNQNVPNLNIYLRLKFIEASTV